MLPLTALERHNNKVTALKSGVFWIEALLGRGIARTNAQASASFLARQSNRQIETDPGLIDRTP
jgi:hypothetical protein